MLPGPAAQSRDRQSHELAGGRLWPGTETAMSVEIARRRPSQLAARGLGDAARRHQQDLLGRRIEQPRRRVPDLPLQPGQRVGLGQPGLGDYDQLLGAGARVGGPEDGDTALADALEIADRRLDLLRIDMAAGADDDVLGAARDEDVAAGGVGEVAAVQPRAVEQLAGLLRIVEVTRGRRGSAELKPALLALADLARGVDDADLVAGQRPAAGDEFQCVGSVRRGRGGAGVPGELAAVDPVDDRRPAERREGEADGILGKPVHGAHRLGTKAIGGKPRREAPHSLRPHGFRTVGDHTQRSEVETGDPGVLDPAQAKLEGEVWRGGQRPPMPVYRPQPCLGSHEKGEGRHHDQRNREVQAAQPRADQAHVVVERQPTHEDVRRFDVHGLTHGANVGQQVGMRQHHSLGIAGAARRVLHQRHARRARHCREWFARRARGEVVDRLDAAQAFDLEAEQPTHCGRLGRRDQYGGASIAQDAGLAAQMLLDARQARRRIDRGRYAAGVEHAEEDGEKGGAGRQHDGNPFAWFQPAAAEAQSNGPRPLGQLSVGDGGLAAVAFDQHDMHAIAVPLDMPVENLGQGHRGVGGRFRRFRSGCAGRSIREDKRRGLGAGESLDEISQRFGFAQQALGQACGKRSFDPQQQLGPGQAVEAPILIEGTVETGAFHGLSTRLDFTGKLAGDPQHRRLWRADRRRLDGRELGRWLAGLRHPCLRWPAAGSGRRPGRR